MAQNMALPTQSLDTGAAAYWIEGQIYQADSLSPESETQMGLLLGISPVVYVQAQEAAPVQAKVQAQVQASEHAQVLEWAARTLGYTGFDVAEVTKSITAALAAAAHAAGQVRTAGAQLSSSLAGQGSYFAVALVPSAKSHKAAPPGTDWLLQISGFTPQLNSSLAHADELRVGLSSYRRNHSSPACNLLLEQDGELLAGQSHRPQTNATLWLNVDNNVALIDQHCVVAVLQDGSEVTPPLSDGALHTAWRQALLAGSAVSERSLSLAELLGAKSVSGLTPWGQTLSVASIEDRVFL